MSRSIAQILLLLLLPSISLANKGDISIPLTVHEALRSGVSGVDRKSEPVTVGIPFPKAMLTEQNGTPQLALVGANDYQFRTLARWPDGSVRWALIDFQADCQAEKMNNNVKVIRGNGNSPGRFLAQDHKDRIIIDTGRITVTISKVSFNLFDSVLMAGQELIASGSSKGIVCVDGNDLTYLGSADPQSNVIIEENGPVRCVVKATGTHYAGHKRMMDFTVRMHFYKGMSRVRVFYTLRNASKKQFEHAFIRSLDLVTRLSLTGPYQVQMAKHNGVIKERVEDKNDDLVYYQAVSDFPQDYAGDSFYWHAPIPADRKKGRRRFSQEGYWIRANDRHLHKGARSEYPDLAFVDMSNENGTGMTVGIRFAAGWWPKSLRASGDGCVEVGLWPKENDVGYWIRYGSHNTFEILYDFHAETVNTIDTVKKFQYPLVAKASVDWYNRNVDGIYPLYHFVSFGDEKEYVEDAGWEYNVGSRKPRMKIWRYHYWGWGGFLNQYDFAQIALVNFLRKTTDPTKAGEYYLYADCRFNYNADWAVYHSDDYACTRCTNRGYGPKKDSDKAVLTKVVFEIEHPHWYGLPLYYYVTGDERIKEAILDWAEVAKNTFDAKKKGWLFVYSRFFGWGMYTLAALYDFTGDTSFMKIADANFTQLLKNPSGDRGNLFIDWQRGYVAGGSGSGWGKDPGLKPGLMTGYIVFDGLYNYYFQLDEKHPLREKVADVLEGVSEFMFTEPYFEGKKKGHWAFWLPYVYNLADKSKSNHEYRLLKMALYTNLASYMAHGEDRWLERMDKIIRMGAWDEAGVWGSFGFIDHPGLQSILYQRLHPRSDTDPPLAIQDLVASSKDSSVILSWTTPPGAVKCQIKYSDRKLVESLQFDPYKRLYSYDPAQYANWWAGENVSGEPNPRKPGERQEFIIKDFKPGHYYFAIRSWDSSNNRSSISNLAEIEIRK